MANRYKTNPVPFLYFNTGNWGSFICPIFLFKMEYIGKSLKINLAIINILSYMVDLPPRCMALFKHDFTISVLNNVFFSPHIYLLFS